MRLKELHLFGFKSFPEKTVIKFSDGITAILGPNGCGKTNILDALRWVLGEQNLSLIRCTRNEELIFAGTKNRPPLNFCEVKLILESDDPNLPYGSEIEIKRRYFRSGEMEYFLNRHPCRLKDIEELFFATGSKAYSLFSLSDIRRIISGEVRRFFDEAANLKKYQESKKEVLQKLELTERDLLRLADIIRERKRIVLSLRRQKRRWEIYEALRREEKKLLLSQILKKKKMKEEEREALSQELEETARRLSSLKQEMERMEKEWQEGKERIKNYERELSQMRKKLTSCIQELVKWESRLSFLRESQNRLVREEEEIRVSLGKEKKPEEILTLKATEDKLEKDLAALREEIKRIEEEISLKEREKEKQEAIRAEIFDGMIRSSSELSAKRSLLAEKEISNLEEIIDQEKILGKAIDFFVWPKEYERAIAAALFPYYSFYLIKDFRIKSYLFPKEIGFLLADGQKEKGEEKRDLNLPCLADVCRIKEDCPQLILSLLRQTFICQDDREAAHLFFQFPNYAFVTKEGICFRPGGVVIIAGSDKTQGLAVAQLREEIVQKEKEIAEWEKLSRLKEEEIRKLEKEIRSLKQVSRERLQKSSEILLRLGKIREERKVLEREWQLIDEEKLKAKLKGEALAKEMAEIEKEMKKANENYEALKRMVAELEKELKEKEEEKGGIEQERLEKEMAQKRTAIENLRKEREEKSLAEALLAREIEEMAKEISQHAAEIGGEVKEEEMLILSGEEERLAEINRKLLNLGKVNPLAKEEYEREKEELDKLLREEMDCQKASADLKSIIKEIDQKVKENFLETFEKVREEFRQVFARLFIEGEGDLILEKPEDPIASDIIIIAKPQGKNPKRLEQLSDGEKALLSLSLLFAFYKVKPAPFSFMDEIDAPLDDANVERFVTFLREMSKNTQVVIITHNRLTLEKVDVLLGVTSEEPGVSKIVTMKLKDQLPPEFI